MNKQELHRDQPPPDWDYSQGLPEGWEEVPSEGKLPHQMSKDDWWVSRFPGKIIRRIKEKVETLNE